MIRRSTTSNGAANRLSTCLRRPTAGWLASIMSRWRALSLRVWHEKRGPSTNVARIIEQMADHTKASSTCGVVPVCDDRANLILEHLECSRAGSVRTRWLCRRRAAKVEASTLSNASETPPVSGSGRHIGIARKRRQHVECALTVNQSKCSALLLERQSDICAENKRSTCTSLTYLVLFLRLASHRSATHACIIICQGH